jgi:hypothetical protein
MGDCRFSVAPSHHLYTYSVTPFRQQLHRMERTVVWFADDCGFTVHVRYGHWVVDRFAVDALTQPVASV